MSPRAQVRAAKILRRIVVFTFLFSIFSALVLFAQNPPQPAPQQPPASDPAKKDSTITVDSSAPAKPASKPHRVFTNDDMPSTSGVPVAPGARLRLKQINRCDRACFLAVEKQALNFGYQSAHPRATRQVMEDSLVNYIEELHADPTWQQLLLDMISAHINVCAVGQNDAQREESSRPHTPTRQEILDEEERMKNNRIAPPGSYQAASSAVMSYRWRVRDPLKASLMVYQWMDESKRDCATIAPPTESDDADDP